MAFSWEIFDYRQLSLAIYAWKPFRSACRIEKKSEDKGKQMSQVDVQLILLGLKSAEPM